MNVRIRPAALGGAFAAIPSKSDAHRGLIAAALSQEPTRILLPRRSADIDVTIACLRALGAGITETEDGADVLPPQKFPKEAAFFCGESGTTLRLLLPVAAAVCETASFSGAGRLPERPVGELLACLAARGAAADSARLPLTLSGKLTPGVFSIAGNVSSQYISGLLFALPLLAGESEIRLTGPLESAGYAEMTRAALARFGVRTEKREQGFLVPGPQVYRSPGEIRVEGDWSNAAPFLAAGAVSAPVACTGLSASLQPDRAILPLLRRFGAAAEEAEGCVTVSPGKLRGIRADVSGTPDLLPVLAALGALAAGETALYNAGRLRLKESDRLSSTAAMLRDLGVRVREFPDALMIAGGTVSGGSVDCANDHRIAMAAAILASAAADETELCGAGCVKKSYPSFFEDFTALGGNVHVL